MFVEASMAGRWGGGAAQGNRQARLQADVKAIEACIGDGLLSKAVARARGPWRWPRTAAHEQHGAGTRSGAVVSGPDRITARTCEGVVLPHGMPTSAAAQTT